MKSCWNLGVSLLGYAGVAKRTYTEKRKQNEHYRENQKNVNGSRINPGPERSQKLGGKLGKRRGSHDAESMSTESTSTEPTSTESTSDEMLWRFMTRALANEDTR